MTILTIDGTLGNDTIVINATGTDSGFYRINTDAPIQFSGVTQLVVNGGAGNDTVTIVNPLGGPLFAPSDGITCNGGGQPGDTLVVDGGFAESGSYVAGATRNAGTLLHNFPGPGTQQTINFAGIALITDTVRTDRPFTINGTAGTDTITIRDGGPVGSFSTTTQVSSPTFATIRFVDKPIVTVDGLGGNDTVTFNNPNPTTLAVLNLTGVGTVSETAPIQLSILSISASGDVTLTNSGNRVNLLAASVGGTLSFTDASALVIGSVFTGTTGITAANHDVTLTANSLDVQEQINAGTGVVTLQPLGAGQAISLGGADSAGVLGLTDAELDHVTASVLRIGNTFNPSNPTLIGQITSDGHYNTLSLATGGAILDGTAGEQTDITVNKLALRAATGVGSPADSLDVAVSNLAFDNVSSGDVSVANAGPLMIGAVDGLVSSSSAGASVQVTTVGALTIAAPIAATGGNINLQTIDTAAAGDDLTVLAGVTLQSSVGIVGLAAGDNLTLQPGSIVQAATFAELLIDVLNADAGVGATASLNGTVIAPSVSIRGGADADTLIGTALGDFIAGGDGADLMIGRAGDDIYFVDNAGDAVVENASEGIDTVLATAHFALPANVENLTLRLGADLQGYGNGLANTLIGNAGNNLLDGRGAADVMRGATGNDTYFVDDGGDQVIENAGEGNDAVFSAAHFVLSANVETLVLQGNADLQGYGNTLANMLYGNAGNNLLDGRGAADVMRGGAGNDTYFIDDAGDQAIENPGEGNDAVFSTAHFVLASNVETLVLQGTADLQGYGNSLANMLYGNAGNNLLDGRGGADIMRGGAGNDAYFVDDGGDQVVENAGEGNDAVFSTAHFALSANVETLVLQGTADLQGYGNTLANMLYGNAGHNLLDGRGAADVMRGGAGNDTYFVDNGLDQVVENPGEGTDAIFSTVHFILPANVETLVLQGAVNANGSGNALANSLFGDSSDNVLDGQGNTDTLTGNAGNDTFVFNVGQADGDTVVDFAGNGAAAGDSLQFVGYGPGATFTNIDTTRWQVNFNGSASHEVITFMNGAAIDATDFVFA